jgi:hypothetical protein
MFRLKKIGDDMISKSNPSQLSIDDFMNDLGQKLDPNNRWIRLADKIPWNEFRRIYHKSLTIDFGRPAKDARLVIGAMIIKHKKGLADEEVIPEIQENPYLQHFIGLKAFTHKPVFDPSLFVTLRKRLGQKMFEELNQVFIDEVTKIERQERQERAKTDSVKTKGDSDSPDSGSSTHHGHLIIDAVVAPQDIQYPTDLNLLNDAREHTERLIDQLWEPESGNRKPRTYRELARRDYLLVVKKKRKSRKVLRSAIRRQLCYVDRNIKTIKKLLKLHEDGRLPIDKHDLKLWWVIQELYRQQKAMYETETNSHPDRIVNLRQPHVRPIVRGKSGRDTEFGSKLSCSLVDRYVYLDRLDWNAFNENQDLPGQVELFKERFGYYPESVHVDQIYGTRENREYLKERGIHFCGKALGRPPQLTKEQKKALRSGLVIRNRIEGKFGEGKRKYQLGLVKTKAQETSESWIACVLFVMNLASWLRSDLLLSFYRIVERRFQRLFQNFKEREPSEIVIPIA